MRYSSMESTTTISDRSVSKPATASPIFGQIEALDQDGLVSKSWRISQPRCTLGSSPESFIKMDDSSMAAVHALVVFGKNHTLIRAVGGQVRIAGRSVREWLIDEPTMIQCGATRCVIYPMGHLRNLNNQGHRVAAGSVTDQAARLRAVSSNGERTFVEATPDAMDSTTAPTIREQANSGPQSSSAEPSPPAFLIAKLDPKDVQTALEPLHLAVQAASEGILALTRLASESTAQIVDVPPIGNHLHEVTQALETLEDRVSTISNYCENLLANVSDSIEGRLSRLDEFPTKLSEVPSSKDYEETLEKPYEIFEPEAYREPTYIEPQDDQATNLEQLDDQPTTIEPLETQSDYLNSREVEATQDYAPFVPLHEDAARYEETSEQESPAPELPNWFTESDRETAVKQDDHLEQDVGSEQAEIAPVDQIDASWSTAQLNPIYAEDSNRWLADEEGIHSELELSPAELNAYSPEPPFEEAVSYEFDSIQEPAYDSILEPEYEEQVVEEQVVEELVAEETGSIFNSEPSYEADEGEEEIREESIEDYMTRLLQRVKGSSDAGPTTIKSSASTLKSRETATSPATVDTQQPMADSPVTNVETSAAQATEVKSIEFTPRQAPPENAANLAALRNLANDTARQALHNSNRKKTEMVLVGKIAIAVLGFGGGMLLLVLNGFRANVAMIGMIASFVVCLLWGYEAVVQFKQLQASKVREASDNEKS